MEKNELYFGFVVNKKSKSVWKGGVGDILDINFDENWAIKEKKKQKKCIPVGIADL